LRKSAAQEIFYKASGNPVISVDSKKKEQIGNLFREEKIYTTETIEVLDHDFASLSEGVAIRFMRRFVDSVATSV